MMTDVSTDLSKSPIPACAHLDLILNAQATLLTQEAKDVLFLHMLWLAASCRLDGRQPSWVYGIFGRREGREVKV